MWIVIPALNEENVIGDTIVSLRNEINKLDSNITGHILVVDDQSSDDTFAIAQSKKEIVVQTTSDIAHTGKGSVLNFATSYIDQHKNEYSENIVLIIDADGRMSSEDIETAIFDFQENPDIGMVQSAVKMININNALEVAQDVEFCGMNRKAQITRDNLGDGIASGNGQFVSLDMAKNVGWDNALLEDMEFTLRGWIKGYTSVFNDHVIVRQQAVSSMYKYIRQRIRWCTGGLQCFKYLGAVYKSKYINTGLKIDLTVDMVIPFLYIFVNVVNIYVFYRQIYILFTYHSVDYTLMSLLFTWIILTFLATISYQRYINWYFKHRENPKMHLSIWKAFINTLYYFVVNVITFFIPIVSLYKIMIGELKWDKTEH
ncbi:glycosyltransferase family 2 protein [Apilactobacillus sp. EABW-1NA]|uniref:glycosyltransferase family 2 protein n=1 Tax=Apilactobacillus sp. EABW-1NA TaxID=2984137 RepID=UPI0025B1FD12|nr:glycosyltransferase family 2 protein [Apilactobacillus sp. EABW-1NA]MDN2613212.1 glycosyltransferase [Apilactobacillus sp. EABW-1NA]